MTEKTTTYFTAYKDPSDGRWFTVEWGMTLAQAVRMAREVRSCGSRPEVKVGRD